MTETYQTIDNDFANNAPPEAIDNEIEALESKIEGKTPANAPPEKSAAVREEAMRAELGAIYDKAQRQGEREMVREMPPAAGPETLDQRFERAADWIDKSPADRKQLSEARNDIQSLKERAAQMGVALDDKDAAVLALQLEGKATATPPEYEAIRQSYPGLQPQQVVSQWNEIDNYVRRSPVEGAAWVYQQATGQSPLELARSIAAKHSPAEHQQYYAQRDLVGYIDGFLASHPDANQEAILQAIGQIQRTGDPRKDFLTAFEVSKGRTPKSGKRRSSDARMRATMEAAYDKAKGRK